MLPWFDTHCHLDAAEFAPDRAAVAARAHAAGVAMLVPAVTRTGFMETCLMRAQHGCMIALGLHPVYVAQHRTEDVDELARQLAHGVARGEVQAIGECGLDGWMPAEARQEERQRELLDAQLRLARDYDLPVILHVRKAQDTVLARLRRHGVRRGIAHAFNGSLQQAEAYLAQGLKLGFGGAMTYARARNLRLLAAHLPLESIVLETDAPDIPPAWLYGARRNEPGELPRIAQTLAELRGLSLTEVAAATRANAQQVLGACGRA